MCIFHLIFDKIIYSLLYNDKSGISVAEFYFRLWALISFIIAFAIVVPFFFVSRIHEEVANARNGWLLYGTSLIIGMVVCLFLKKRKFVESVIEQYCTFSDSYKKDHHIEWVLKGCVPLATIPAIVALFTFLMDRYVFC